MLPPINRVYERKQSLPATEAASALVSLHHMQTRSRTKCESFPHKALLATSQPISDIDLDPTCYTQASKQKHWRDAMAVEFDALTKNHTWSLVPASEASNIVGYKWVFKTILRLMDLLSGIRCVWSQKAIHKRRAWTIQKRSARWLNRQLSALFSHLQSQINGAFVSWMLTTLLYMESYKKLYACPNPLAFKILAIHLMFADSTKQFTGRVNLLGHGTINCVTHCLKLVFIYSLRILVHFST
jgi:hypothetical protein